MRKIIKKYGNTHVVSFNTEEMKANKLKKGSIVEVKKVEPELAVPKERKNEA